MCRCWDFSTFLGFGNARAWFLGALFWTAVVLGIGYVAFRISRKGPPRDTARADREDALEILKRRLAEGKITLEEYEFMRKVLIK
ncbi:MAG: hypothetical protein GYA47_14130 [Desulfovibrio sp.]|nr:hypothetical protein [Desulfovibrio sp.]